MNPRRPCSRRARALQAARSCRRRAGGGQSCIEIPLNHEGHEVREGFFKRLVARRAMFVALVACLVAARGAEPPSLRAYESKYYQIHTDLPEVDAREAQI